MTVNMFLVVEFFLNLRQLSGARLSVPGIMGEYPACMHFIMMGRLCF